MQTTVSIKCKQEPMGGQVGMASEASNPTAAVIMHYASAARPFARGPDLSYHWLLFAFNIGFRS